MKTNYKQTPISPAQKEWEVVRLGEVAEIRGNKIVSGVNEVAFIPMEFVPDQEIFTKYEMRNLKDVKSSTYCEAGDLLLAKITPSLENGKQGIVPDDIPNGFAFATTEVYPIVCKGIDKLFLFSILKFPKFRKVLEFSMRGTTGRQRVPKEAVEKLKVPFPPLPEQRRIAEILSTVDEAIQRVDEAIARTERLKRGLMQELLTKGIGHKEFKFSKELGCEIPKEWGVVRLGEIVAHEKGRKPKALLDRREQNTLPYLSAETLRTGTFTQWARETGEFMKVNRDDVILIWDGFYCGDSFIGFEGILSSTMIKIESKKPSLNKRFLFCFLKTRFKELNSKISGMYLKHVNKSVFESLKLPLPPLAEQQKIVEVISTVGKKLELERKRKEKLERIKRGLMNDLLTGKKRMKVGDEHG